MAVYPFPEIPLSQKHPFSDDRVSPKTGTLNSLKQILEGSQGICEVARFWLIFGISGLEWQHRYIQTFGFNINGFLGKNLSETKKPVGFSPAGHIISI